MRGHQRDIRRLKSVLRRLTAVLVVIGLIALVFTATSVTLFAIRHGVHPGIAWLLDPMVALALGTVLITDGVLAEYGIRPRGWSTALRYFAGLATWVMNCWSSVWPPETSFGKPEHVDAAGLVLHSIPPVLLIALAEAVTHYRRAILAKITELEDDDQDSAPAVRPEPVPVVVPEPVPAKVRVPVAYPEPPEAVPDGVRLLPIVARPRPDVRDIEPARQAPVFAAVEPRTRPEVHAEYAPQTPDPEPQTEPGSDLAPPDEDPLTAQVRHDFAARLKAGQLPPYRSLKANYHINQDRAQRIRDDLTKELVA